MERPAGGFGGFEGGQTAGLNALKNRWLGRGLREGLVVGAAVARLRPLKLGRPFEHRQAIVAGTTLDNVRAMAVTKQVPPALKNRWLGRVAARVALERPAGRFGRGSCRGAFEAFEAWQTI